MDVLTSNSLNVGVTSAASNETLATESSTAIEADFNTFLTLLTTQLRNQDPLNPTDSTEFVAQLASFSTVEQQTQTNDLLRDLIGVSGTAGTLSSGVAWIGKDVAAPGGFSFDGTQEQVPLIVSPKPAAQVAVLTVYNDFGGIVRTEPVSPSESDLTWDGRNTDGALMPPGTYTATVTYFRDDQPIGIEGAQGYATVEEVRMSPAGQLELYLDNGSQVLESDVTAVRG